MDGKNIADFVDPDILEKLEALEKEEEALENAMDDSDEESDLDEEDQRLVEKIRSKRKVIVARHRRNKETAPSFSGTSGPTVKKYLKIIWKRRLGLGLPGTCPAAGSASALYHERETVTVRSTSTSMVLVTRKMTGVVPCRALTTVANRKRRVT